MLKKLLILLLLVFGIVVLFFKDDILEFWDTFGNNDTRPVIANVENYSGKVLYKLPEQLVYKKAKQGMPLKSFDTLTTDTDGTAKVRFKEGLLLEVEPNSVLVIEKPEVGSSGVLQITFLRGQYRVIEAGKTGAFVIQRENVVEDPSARKAPSEPMRIALKPSAPVPIPSPTPTPTIAMKPSPTPTPVVVAKETLEDVKIKPKVKPKVTPIPDQEVLPDDYIINTVKGQKAMFQRCYISHLRLNPNTSGRINLTFVIDPDGRVSSVRVLKSTIPDPKLQQCVMAVIERIKFRSYTGNPTRINYPIDFN